MEISSQPKPLITLKSERIADTGRGGVSQKSDRDEIFSNILLKHINLQRLFYCNSYLIVPTEGGCVCVFFFFVNILDFIAQIAQI